MRPITISSITIGDRTRADPGDVDTLAKAIADDALANPVIVAARQRRLISGYRRLLACQQLGMVQVPAVEVADLPAAVATLAAEREHGPVGEPMTPSELVHLGLVLEWLDEPAATERRRVKSAMAKQPRTNGQTNGSASLHSRELIAGAIGISGSTYYRARLIVRTALDVGVEPRIRDAAAAAMREMDTTGLIGPSYYKVIGLIRPRLRTDHGAPADAGTQRRVIANAVTTLGGIGHALATIGRLDPAITTVEAAQWLGGLNAARRDLTALINQLKERSK